ncbi:MAG: 50S ribosomal protein L31 [Candidatus Pacebacteria bacterium]|nr:50S ribosomal protein L31 [Candidatus Paceibacterota bacterium]
MKEKIHPKYYPNAKVNCACGANFEIGSTKDIIETEVCYKCHPFYTGKEKIIDTAGRVEKFKKRIAKKEELKTKVSKAKLSSVKEAKAKK